MLEGLVGNELEQTSFTCTAAEKVTLCYTEGEQFLDFYGMSADHKVALTEYQHCVRSDGLQWRNWGLLLIFTAVLRFITWLLLTYKRFQTK